MKAHSFAAIKHLSVTTLCVNAYMTKLNDSRGHLSSFSIVLPPPHDWMRDHKVMWDDLKSQKKSEINEYCPFFRSLLKFLFFSH